MSIAGFAFDEAEADRVSAFLLAAQQAARDEADAAIGRPIKRTKSGGFSDKDLRLALFEDLRAPIYFRSELTNRPSLGVDTLRAYAAAHDERLRRIALAILSYRRIRKVRSTYVDAIIVGDDGRVHPTWNNAGPVSGRFSCQAPNLMNLPRYENDPSVIWGTDEAGERRYLSGGVRTLYVAPPGYVLVTFDAKQLEMRVAAYASGDEAMIAACESSDLHASNAAIIFGEAFATADPPTRKRLRTLAKTSGFAVCYLAEADTVYARLIADGVNVKLRQVEAMITRLKGGFRGYYRWQDRRLLDCIRDGWTDTPLLGRRRWLSHDPSPTECANFPIQGGAADLMNMRLPQIVNELRNVSPRARLVAQVHDSGVFEVPRDDAKCVADTCRRIFETPVVISSSGKKLEASFPIDIEISERWH